LIVNEWADLSLPSRAGRPLPYDGIVGRITAPGSQRAKRLDLPVVNLWYSSPAKGLPGVFPDNRAGGRLIAEHLLNRGFQHLAALVADFDRASQLQAEAMEAAVNGSSMGGSFSKLTVGWEHGHADWLRSVRQIERWMQTWQLPVGLMVREHKQARLIIEMARERGWHVPDQIAIICTTNDEIICERPEPSLTALDVPDEQCGYEAAKLLDQLIDAKRKGVSPYAEPRTVLLPPVGVVARHSTDFFAVTDPLVRQALRYIAEHLAKPLDVENVARKLDVSRRTLDARFHETLGKTVVSEIQRLRIERVKRELAGGSLSIEVVARRAGFASPRTPYDQFVRATGVSPSDFRKQAAAPR
jgi:LacI family transcriptional regulator